MPKKIELPGDLITAAEAARLRGVTAPAIRFLIARGRMPVYRVAGKVFLSKREVEAWRPLPAGAPPKIKQKPKK